MPYLVVDDSKAMRMLIGRALRQTGRREEVIEAASGQEALERAAEYRPETILSDWNMPGMDGIELVTRIRETSPEVKFLFITTEWTPQQEELALRAGANGLLAKPFSVDELDKALERLGL